MAKKKAKKQPAKTAKQARSDAPRRKERTKGKQSGPWTHDDLSQELQRLALRIVNIEPDGNCLFGALGDQLRGRDADHAQLRREVVDFVQAHPNDFAAFIEDDEPFEDYCQRLREDGTWAGNIELQAASLLYEVNISVHQAEQPVWTIQNFEGKGQKARTIHLSYHNGDHYNSVRLADDFGDGAAQEVPTGGPAIAKQPPPPEQDRHAEELVERGTGCSERDAIAAALKDSGGNADKAIEVLIERMAAGAQLDEAPQADEITAAAKPAADGGNSSTGGVGYFVAEHPARANDAEGSMAALEGKEERAHKEPKRPPRNRPCPCGSKQKYKNCCGSAARLRKASAAASSADAAVLDMPKQLLV